MNSRCAPYCYSYNTLVETKKPLKKFGNFKRVIDHEKVEFFHSDYNLAILTVYKDNRIWLKNSFFPTAYGIFMKNIQRLSFATLERDKKLETLIGMTIRFKSIYPRLEKKSTGMFYIRKKTVYRFVPTPEYIYQLFKAVCIFDNTQTLHFIREGGKNNLFYHAIKYNEEAFWELFISLIPEKFRQDYLEATFISFVIYSTTIPHNNDELEQLKSLFNLSSSKFKLYAFK